MHGRFSNAPARIRLLGGEVDLVTPAEVLSFTGQTIKDGRKAVIANHNLHSLHLIRRNAGMQALYRRADLIEADSTPLIAWGKLLGRPISRAHRSTYLDWREEFWRLAVTNGWRVFYLGGAPGVAERAAGAIRGRWPGAEIGVRDGFFDAAGPENEAVLAEIAAFRPDVLFVGMGMPRQEAWAAAVLDRLPPCVVFTVGAAFDYEAGVVPTPPRWTGRVGLEWLWRFGAEPRRLFTRYFLEPWSLLPQALGDLRARSPGPERPELSRQV